MGAEAKTSFCPCDGREDDDTADFCSSIRLYMQMFFVRARGRGGDAAIAETAGRLFLRRRRCFLSSFFFSIQSFFKRARDDASSTGYALFFPERLLF